MIQPTLPRAPRTHDLPPCWDGHVVAWDGWEAPSPSVVICPPLPSRCPACGSFAAPVTNRGRVANSAITTAERLTRQAAKRDALPLGVRHEAGRPLALYRLVAHRCPDCQHDMVLEDWATWWDLDDSDYGDGGSWPAP